MKSNKQNFIYTFFFLLSAIIALFLVWFIYLKPGAASDYTWVKYLPYVNASLNTLSTIFLVSGFVFIKRGDEKKHIRCMSSAVVTSLFFLVSYLTYHHFHGDTKFVAQGLIRYSYFAILISHIVLSMAMLPMILITLWNAFTDNLEKHKAWAKYTFPVWLYVSVTGIIIVIYLQLLNY